MAAAASPAVSAGAPASLANETKETKEMKSTETKSKSSDVHTPYDAPIDQILASAAKQTQRWREVAGAYLKCAGICMAEGQKDAAFEHFGNAGKALNNLEGREVEAIALMNLCAWNHVQATPKRLVKAALLYLMAAKTTERLFVNDQRGENADQADDVLKAYDTASKVFFEAGHISDGMFCQSKAADFEAANQWYRKATERYDTLILLSVKHDALVSKIKDWILNSVLCECLGAIQAQDDIQAAYRDLVSVMKNYERDHPDFEMSHEATLAYSFLKAYKNQDTSVAETAVTWFLKCRGFSKVQIRLGDLIGKFCRQKPKDDAKDDPLLTKSC